MHQFQFVSGLALGALLLCAPIAAGDEVVRVAWHSDVQNAWQATQQQGQPMLVFVTRDNCFYCTQMKSRTYSDATVAGTIKSSFVPLELDGSGNSPLLKDLKVTAYPTTFVISPKAVILDRIDGYVAPDVLARRLSALRPPVPVANVVKDK